MNSHTFRPSPARTAAATLAVALVATFSADALAQSQCPPATPIVPWVPADIGNLFMGSALEADGMIQLCSANAGLATIADGYRLAVRAVEGDFTVESLVIAVEAGAGGGLITTTAQIPDGDSPRVAVLAEPVDQDAAAVRLRVSVRMNKGDAANWMQLQPVVPLPVRLIMRRLDGVLYVEYEYQGAVALLHSQPTDGTDLESNLSAGMLQTSNDAQTARSAWFGRPSSTLPQLPPAPACGEDGVMLGDGQPLAIKGHWMDRATEVRFDGVPATILEKSPRRLVVQPPPNSPQPSRRTVTVHTRYARAELPGGIALVGSPFVRGDVNQDGQVTPEDWKQICYAVHRSNPPACMTAADINADGGVNQTDLDQLETFLKTGERPPAGPFPQPGYVAGGLSCGLPAGPSLQQIVDGTGRPIRKKLGQGDIILVRGASIPAADGVVLLFGDVRLDVLNVSADGKELKARVGVVAKDGVRCPTIMNAPDDGGHPGATRFGPAYSVKQGSPLCLDFAVTTSARALSAVADRNGVIALSIPRASLVPGTELVVDASYLMPFVDGQSGGPRVAQMRFHVPGSGSRTDSYELGMTKLAEVLSKKFNGHDDDECDCEVDVQANPAEEKLILKPCLPPPPPPPEPVVPGLPTQVKPIQIIVGHLGLFNPFELPTCADNYDIYEQPRLHGWCEFAKMVTEVQQGPNAGLAAFEALMPIRFIEGVFENPDEYKAPADRDIEQKKIMITSTPANYQSFIDGDYANPCGLALRRTQCNASEGDWNRAIKSGSHVIKTMWRTKAKLPLHMNESLLYSYVDPDGNRQYLVGMHVAVSDGISAHDHYLRWNTFWAPAPFGDTLTKDGTSLDIQYSPHCTSGHGNDRPAEFVGTIWQNWRMCNDSAAGEAACGNPWIPSECPANGTESCTGCHETTFGTMLLGVSNLQTGWIASVRNQTVSRAQTCVAEIEADISQFSDWMEPLDGISPESCNHY